MEHADAGVHTVLADVERPAQYHPGPGEEAAHAAAPLPVPAPPPVPVVPASAALVGTGPHPIPVTANATVVAPPAMPGLGRQELVGSGHGTDVDDLDDSDLDEDDDEEDEEDDESGVLVSPGDVRLTQVDGPLADSLAQVIDIGFGDLLGEVMEWQERALCAQTDPEAFFPEKGGSTREAKRICSGCEVRIECLEYALENDERFGIWGGMSERERRKQRRRAV
ncbi:transcription factor WhiB [Frankia sp. CcI49]|uniref:WhiB family transcriptional regulator n=1 Tax=unclassified Frankia TaxID=2632575 RepID=UPI0006C9E9B7|nr:WhiB family transcriptional regulator [Frankia sp. CcI49]KPM51431.1 transcription factor WhiB [Frankia sp. R43]ONH52997.1 transcription factor WhiB [Frankia sp. CcI49]